MMLLGMFLVGCVAYFVADVAAARRGRSGRWALAAFLCSPITLVVLCLPKKKGAEYHTRWYSIPVEVAFVLCLLFVASSVAYVAVETGSVGGVPECDSPFATGTAKSAFAGAPVGKLLGLAIIDLQNIHETSSNDTGRRCTATALLNNATQHPAEFDITKHGSEWFVTIRVSGL